MDLPDLQHNTRDRVHITSLAGTQVALVSASVASVTRTGRSASRRGSLPAGLAVGPGRACGAGVRDLPWPRIAGCREERTGV